MEQQTIEAIIVAAILFINGLAYGVFITSIILSDDGPKVTDAVYFLMLVFASVLISYGVMGTLAALGGVAQ